MLFFSFQLVSAIVDSTTSGSNQVASSLGGAGGAVPVSTTAANVVTETSISKQCEKYYICPDGTKVKYCELIVTENAAGCGCKKNPELLCPGGGAATGGTGAKVPQAVEIKPTKTTQSVCVVDDGLMKELDELMRELKIAEENNNEQQRLTLREKIRSIKVQIEEDTTRCKNTVTSVQKVKVVMVDACAELKQWEKKYEYYIQLREMSIEKLKEKGYLDKKEIERVLSQLKEGMEKLKKRCNELETATTSTTATTSNVATAETSVAIALVAVENTNEILSYYKKKMTSIMEPKADIEDRISNLKQLRNEIDNLISDLIKSRDEISTEGMEGIIKEIKIMPKKIEADDVVVLTTNKKILTKIAEQNVEISLSETQVSISDSGVKANAKEISIKDGVVKVGVTPVNVRPSQIMDKITLMPEEIELKEEKGIAVYKVKADEKRKILGIIPIEIRKEITIDATNSSANIVGEKGVWWGFITTKA